MLLVSWRIGAVAHSRSVARWAEALRLIASLPRNATSITARRITEAGQQTVSLQKTVS